MIRLMHNETLADDLPQRTITLRIENNDRDGGYISSYGSSSKLYFRSEIVIITILIETKIANLDTLSINSYASTGFLNSESELFLGLIPTSPISRFTGFQSAKPDKPYNPVTFTLKLNPNQIIDFGIFVTVLLKDGSSDTFLCDPQASNDPRITGTVTGS
jgi:hypothetical protein